MPIPTFPVAFMAKRTFVPLVKPSCIKNPPSVESFILAEIEYELDELSALVNFN